VHAATEGTISQRRSSPFEPRDIPKSSTVNTRTKVAELERIPSELCVGAGGDAGYAAVRATLEDTTLGEYLASKPPSAVLTLSTAQTAGQALRALAAANVLSAPLFDAAR
jgi:hypothetical protein